MRQVTHFAPARDLDRGLQVDQGAINLRHDLPTTIFYTLKEGSVDDA
jgi:hypothetical protein